MIAFTMMVILIIITTLNSLRVDYQEFIGGYEIQEVCAVVKGGIEKIYRIENYVSQTNTTMGEIILELPKRIANVNYQARFVNSSLEIKTIGEPFLNDTCSIGFDVNLNGRTTGSTTRIKWTRYANGTDVIEMRRL